jgi:hypothetical protein
MQRALRPPRQILSGLAAHGVVMAPDKADISCVSYNSGSHGTFLFFNPEPLSQSDIGHEITLHIF